MPQITFEIDGTQHLVEVSTVDPNQVYQSFDKVVEKVNNSGWEFNSEAAKPDYEELSNIGRKSEGSGIQLGDITGRVRPASSSSDDEPDDLSDSEEESHSHGEISLTVSDPDGRSEKFHLGKEQNLGSLKAKISERWNLNLSERVELYEDSSLTSAIEGKTEATDVDGETIYFDTLE